MNRLGKNQYTRFEMDKEEYFRLKSEGWKDESIATDRGISVRTLDRWKKREGIYDSLHRRRENGS